MARTLRPAREVAILLAILAISGCGGPDLYGPAIGVPPGVPGDPGTPSLAFSVAADMRGFIGAPASDGGTEFRAAMDALSALGPGAFMLSPGDIDPPAPVGAAIGAALGSGFPWLPVIGNHEAETPEDMAYLRVYDLAGSAEAAGAANFAAGPAGAANTMYSFDEGGAHFAIINEYFDGSSDIGVDPPPSDAMAGTVSAATYAWLASDLSAAAARSPAYVFVVGHEPAYPLPDASSGRLRHRGDSLDAHLAEVEDFVALLRRFRVTAYICGHTHDFSAALVDGLLQIDAGHARGSADAGAPSTFLVFELSANMAIMKAYRSSDGAAYAMASELRMAPRID